MADVGGAEEPMMGVKDRTATVKLIPGTGPAGACLSCIYATPEWCRENLLLVLTVAGVVLGIVVGFSLRTADLSEDTIMILSFPGDMLMSMLKMLIVPLIISSMITGLASLDPVNSGRMGLRAIVYYFMTTFIAIILGIILVLAIHPGEHDLGVRRRSVKEQHTPTSVDAFMDLLRNIFPSNILQACFQHTKTVYTMEEPEEYILTKPNISDLLNQFNTTTTASTTTTTQTTTTNTTNETVVFIQKEVKKWVRIYPMADGVNVLGIITFCTVFGILISNMGAKGKIMIEFFGVLNEIIMKMVFLAMWYSPVGIMFLITGKILQLEDPAKVGQQLGMYMVTILLGLTIHTLAVLPSIYFVMTRKNPFRIMWGVVQAWVTALGTASSTATLPVTFHCLEDKLHIDKRVTRFVLPIGATINMDGTALYEAVAPIFIAQMNGMELTFGKIVAISLTATCASIGAAAIPSAGLVTMVMVLTSVGIPADDISLILAVDWFLDRFRTATNILGDSFGAAVVEHLSRHELQLDPHSPIDDAPEFDMHNNKNKSVANSTAERITEDQL
ncbi:unnamed protein product [Candidula unifasciata]|uniref:Amino acid transporter n=1 Tax=Candidula unifasciata TaxID=100452 RepID=A0A8S3ZUN4_9EUPU|nr:unnamed protein product [Candidula unifasciata]